MRKFLSLFPLYRSMDAELRSSAARRIELEDEVRRSREEISRLSRDLETARKDANHATQLIADFFCQWTTGRKLFNASPELPTDSPEAPVIRGNRQQARAVQQQETNAAIMSVLGAEYEEELGVY